jgi:hypothetical protein
MCGSKKLLYFYLLSLQLKHIGLDFKARRARTTNEKSTSITDAAVFRNINCKNFGISSG